MLVRAGKKEKSVSLNRLNGESIRIDLDIQIDLDTLRMNDRSESNRYSRSLLLFISWCSQLLFACSLAARLFDLVDLVECLVVCRTFLLL